MSIQNEVYSLLVNLARNIYFKVLGILLRKSNSAYQYRRTIVTNSLSLDMHYWNFFMWVSGILYFNVIIKDIPIMS